MLSEALKQAMDYVLCQLHTGMPGEVISYDPGTRLADIQPLISRKYVDGQVLKMPVLSRVPVGMLSSSRGSVSIGVDKGDTGWIAFAERSIDNWILSGGQQEPAFPRRHALSDAVFYPGIGPGKPGKPGSNKDVELIAGGASIVIDGGKITVTDAAGSTVTLGGDGTIEVLDQAGDMVTVGNGTIAAQTVTGSAVTLGPGTVLATDGAGDVLSLGAGAAYITNAAGDRMDFGGGAGIKIVSGGSELHAQGGTIALGGNGGVELVQLLGRALQALSVTTVGSTAISTQSTFATLADQLAMITGTL